MKINSHNHSTHQPHQNQTGTLPLLEWKTRQCKQTKFYTFVEIFCWVELNVEKASLGHKYKDKLEISTLALVDDNIGVTEAAQMNTVLDVKTAEQNLLFGISKCKSMSITRQIKPLLL